MQGSETAAHDGVTATVPRHEEDRHIVGRGDDARLVVIAAVPRVQLSALSGSEPLCVRMRPRHSLDRHVHVVPSIRCQRRSRYRGEISQMLPIRTDSGFSEFRFLCTVAA